MSDRLRAAAQRALESLDDLIANTTDPGVEALGARHELAAALSNAGPIVIRRRRRDVEAHETDEQRTDRLETARDHAAGQHEYCGLACETEFPSDMLRNGILARAIPGSNAMLNELLRRMPLTPPPAGWTGADEAKWQAEWDSRPVGADVSDLIEFVPVPVEAHRPLTEYIAEVQEVDGIWMYLQADPDRRVVEERRASMTRRHPDAKTRVIRKITTYTLEPDSAPAGPAETEARPAEHTWAVELHDPLADEWVPGTRYPVRERAVNHLHHANAIGPAWKDGPPVERRLVRSTTTHTVEPDPAPAEDATCTCVDAGAAFASAGHYADCPDASAP
ncbi:hypothetical protein ACFVJK_46815 [Streptomyces sp. NPDC127172]|uniref:hypothetical protein n=1 Tax=Streptomyces sp. NPDC127172 TaxID=3345382 RepID=UPI00363298D7